MHDLYFIICGMRIMRIMRIMTLTLGSGPSVVAWIRPHCGPSFFIGESPPTPFIEWRLGPAHLDLRSRLMYISFSAPYGTNIFL